MLYFCLTKHCYCFLVRHIIISSVLILNISNKIYYISYFFVEIAAIPPLCFWLFMVIWGLTISSIWVRLPPDRRFWGRFALVHFYPLCGVFNNTHLNMRLWSIVLNVWATDSNNLIILTSGYIFYIVIFDVFWAHVPCFILFKSAFLFPMLTACSLSLC